MAINYICCKAMCHHKFQEFLLEIQAEYRDVVYHNDVKWLSLGSALKRFYCLRKEIGQFLTKKIIFKMIYNCRTRLEKSLSEKA